VIGTRQARRVGEPSEATRPRRLALSLLGIVARRLAVAVLVLTAISFVIFSLLALSPSDPVRTLLGTQQATPAQIASLRSEFHLDEPFLEQYRLWLTAVLHLDLGESLRSGEPVTTLIAQRFDVTLFVGLYGFAMSVLVGIPLGLVAAFRQRSTIDRGIVGITVLGASTPTFVTGVLLLYLLAVALGMFPTYGAGEGFGDRLWHLTLPALALGLTATALIVKFTRAAGVRVLEQDYVAFALARGVPMRRVVTRYVLRNALVPVITASGIVLTSLLTGAVLVEATFALPGVGSLLISAVTTEDIPVVQGVALLAAVVIVAVNLVTDVLYALVDPRITYGRAAS
jgi:peptide/nickel transport system permease protein